MRFYITGLYHTNELNDFTLPPIAVEANSRMEALAMLGATVWTDEEFKAMRGDLADEHYPEPVKWRC